MGQSIVIANAAAETKQMMSTLSQTNIEAVYANLVFIERKAKELQCSLEKLRNPNTQPLPDGKKLLLSRQFADDRTQCMNVGHVAIIKKTIFLQWRSS